MLLGKIHAFEIHVLSRFDVRSLLDRSAVLRFLKQLQSDPVAKEELDIFGKTSPFPGSESCLLTEHLADLVVGGHALLESNLRQLFWRHHVSSLSKSYALMFLRQFSTSAGAMCNMREFVRKCKALPNVCTIRDDIVQEQLASSIASGEAVVGFRTLNRIGGGVPPPFGPTAPPPAPAPRVERTWEPDPATFSSSHDAGSQAQALLAAAQNGIPFCEECQKATQ
jgi:hypothetical protein